MVAKKQLLKHDDLLKWCTSQISKIITKTEKFEESIEVLYCRLQYLSYLLELGPSPTTSSPKGPLRPMPQITKIPHDITHELEEGKCSNLSFVLTIYNQE